MSIRKEDALVYHTKGKPGKIEVVPTKETKTQRDLALAYSPGVAWPCLEIADNPETVYNYTARGNLVAVISNGTAVLGLGNIGPEASKPVMEGKGLLFKVFADIDVFDLELNVTDPEEFVRVVKALEPTFGGINLEDIKAPDCFEIEQRLKAEMQIPVMHDDQHGTAIISGAALINALEITGKKIDQVRIVVSGAGASALSCSRLFLELGAKRENLVMLDSKGVLRKDRTDLDRYKLEFVTERDLLHLEDSLVGADVFVGLSRGNIMTPEMLLSMAENPIVFALANPDPEIDYNLARSARPDVIVATGRSDFPNQVNNALGFPFIFRGALDVRAKAINDAMKLAAVHAIAELAKKPVPEIVNLAYNQKNMVFGREYIIPKPIDPRLVTTVSPAVAKAAMESGVSRINITDWEAYKNSLVARMGHEDRITRIMQNKAKLAPKKVVFAEADNLKILKAAQIAADEGIAEPILLGNINKIKYLIESNHLDLGNVTIIDPEADANGQQRQAFGKYFFEKRKRKGFNFYEAQKVMKDRTYYGCMMVEMGQADALISGLTRNYGDTIRPALQVIGIEKGVSRVAGMYIMLTRKGPIFFSDTTVNANPTAEELADITVLTAKAVQQFNIAPRIALLSYSNFGTNKGEEPKKVRQALDLLRRNHPELEVDGEMQANFALNRELLAENYPFTDLLSGEVNTLIFPNLSAGNIAYKMLQELGAAEAIGPVLLGLAKPVHILQLGSSVREIVNMITLAVVDAQAKQNNS